MVSYSEWGSGACFVSLVHACFFLTSHDSSFMKPTLQLWACSLCSFWLQWWSHNPLGVIFLGAPVLNQDPENLFFDWWSLGFLYPWKTALKCIFTLSAFLVWVSNPCLDIQSLLSFKIHSWELCWCWSFIIHSWGEPCSGKTERCNSPV